MKKQEDKLVETLLEPDVVIQSQSDETVRLFHRLYKGTIVGAIIREYPLKEQSYLDCGKFSPRR
jgi:hypothetical protein